MRPRARMPDAPSWNTPTRLGRLSGARSPGGRGTGCPGASVASYGLGAGLEQSQSGCTSHIVVSVRLTVHQRKAPQPSTSMDR